MTLGLVMIVRDEADRIRPTLEAVAPYISHWTICDTGSTDGTQAIIREVLAEVPGTLYHDEWVNFGANRTRAFERAKGTASWLLALDADMILRGRDFVPDESVDAYMVDMGNGGTFSYRLPLVLRGDLPWRSIGAVHEYTALPWGPGHRENTDAIQIRMPHATPMTPAKLEWHADMLVRALIEHPKDPRSTFYLAQTRRDQGRTGEARALYLERAAMGDWDQEQFVAAYQAAGLAPTWEQRSAELLAAWQSRPSRLEPLYDLAHGLNERGQYAEALRLTDVPIEPPTDVLFVHRAVWDWGLAYERDVAAKGLAAA